MTSHDLTATARVQLIAKYATPGTDVGIPWDLFEDYIRELSQLQREQQMFCFSSASEVSSRRTLSAPVLGPAHGADFVTTGRSALTHVYPVIK
jgi:hypothetical protein